VLSSHEIFIIILAEKQENIWSIKGFWASPDKIAQTPAVFYIKVIINSVINNERAFRG